MRSGTYRNKKSNRWGALLLLLPLLSACSEVPNPSQKGSLQIDPPPSALEQAMIEGTLSTAMSDGSDMITVYLLDRNGYLAPMSLRVEGDQTSTQATAEKAIHWMTVNNKQADQLPPGFKAILPEGTKLASVSENKAEQTIAVDFATPLPAILASQEQKVLEALVWTLTELPGINKVKLSVAGQPLRSFPASGLPVDQVLTRGVGINLEAEKGVQINRSMAVTLYFSAQSSDGEGYFVPVTRLINRQADIAKAALEQLILGPQNSKLSSVLSKGMSIEQLSQMADTINVSLRDTQRKPEAAVPAEMMEALVLTLTEATDTPQVRVVLNGDDSLVDSDKNSYEYPVTRPTPINVYQR
ncbi:GerMN domain-containing protein [Cohnella sp.]|uniref:GerMN domain-containing protein n=1 Tax=Cohnella sp. TaxID=1883426 RepID=UPI00356A200D